MKPWQKGVPLQRLKKTVLLFQPYNALVYGGTTRVNQLKMAGWMAQKEIVQVGPKGKQSLFHTKILKVKSPAYLYRGKSSQVLSHQRRRGDRLIDMLAINKASEKKIVKVLRSYKEDCWIETIAKDKQASRVAKGAGFRKVSASAASESDIFSIWYRGGKRPDDVKVIPAIEKANVVRLPVGYISKEVSAIARSLESLPGFQNHDGTKYNKDHSWSAISLRGYSTNPRMIEDPAEKPAKFLKSSEGKGYTKKLHNTPLWRTLPEVKALLKKLVPNWNGDEKSNPFYRVRFMALRENEGELSRHTDLTDSTLGFGAGRKVRIHFPILTNPKVKFTSWDLDDKPKTVNMKKGSCWYLNIRLPHRAVNGGKQRRVHCVVDIRSDAIQPLIERAVGR